MIKPAFKLVANHKLVVSVALGVDWVRAKFEFALGKVLSWYVSNLMMITYRKTLGFARTKGRDEGNTCLLPAVPRFTRRMIVILVRNEMPVILAAVDWGSFTRLAIRWHFEADEAWGAIRSVIGNFRGRRWVREIKGLMEKYKRPGLVSVRFMLWIVP